MAWLPLLKSIITIAASLSKWLGDKQLIETGEAKQISRRLLRERDRVQKAIDARNNIKHDADRVSNDKNNRSSN